MVDFRSDGYSDSPARPPRELVSGGDDGDKEEVLIARGRGAEEGMN